MGQGRSRIEQKSVTTKGRTVPTREFDVLMILGVCEWGPMWEPTISYDYPDWEETFGRHIAGYHTSVLVKEFFANGGSKVVTSRVCHQTGATPDSAAKGVKYLYTSNVAPYGVQQTLKVEGLYYGDLALSIKVVAASDGDAEHFDFIVYRDGTLVEWFRNLTMDTSADRYAIDVVNSASGKSLFVRLTDMSASGDTATRRPANLSSAVALLGGDDGLTSIATSDYTGNATYRTGLYSFNTIATGDLLMCSDDTTTTFQNAAVSYCETEKKMKVLFLTDPPAGADKDTVKTHAAALTISECRTKVNWPRIKIANPDKSIYGAADKITVVPGAHIAARMAKNSQSEKQKYFVNPSNEEFGWLDQVVGLEGTEGERHEVLDDSVQDEVTDNGINPILSGNRGIDGAWGVWLNDCLLGKVTGNFISIGEGHGIAYLRTVFELYLERHRTQGNSETRRRDIKRALEAELMKWTNAEAFASQSKDEAFYVNTDPAGESLNNPLVQDEQKLRILIGVATARPARFIEIMFTRDARAVESYIQQQLAA